MNSFSYFSGSKKTVAQFVEDYRKASKPGSVLTTIMKPGLLGACSVRIATDVSSEDTEREMARWDSFLPHTTISIETIRVG